MIMLQFADENPISWKKNIEYCERYESSLIHYENHEKFKFLKVHAQSMMKLLKNTTQSTQDHQLVDPQSESDLIFIG